MMSSKAIDSLEQLDLFKPQEYTLGLDLGIKSIGWAILSGDRIANAGVYLFETAEELNSTGNKLISKAAERGRKRRIRRMLDRKARRGRHIRYLLEREGLPTEELEEVVVHQSNRTLWDVRAEAVERKLTKQELAAVLFHLVRHRGYFPNTKKLLPDDGTDSADEEQGKINRATSRLREELKASDCKTIGQFLAQNRDRQRNREGDYSNLMARKLVFEETLQILAFQRKQGHELSKDFEKTYLDVLMGQRSGRSPKLGNCSLIPSELRAPSSAPSTEWFKFLQNLGNLQISNAYREEWSIDAPRRAQIIDACSQRSTSSYWQIRRDFQIPDEYRFNLVNYERRDPDVDLQEYLQQQERKTLANFRNWKQLEKIIGTGHPIQTLDEAARLITLIKDDEKLSDQLADLLPKASDKAITQLCELDFTTAAKISLEAMYRILPHMNQGMGFFDACQQESLPEIGVPPAGDRVPPFDEMYNPVVNRALSQSRKLINAVIDEYGMPAKIRVELARDLGKGRELRERIKLDQLDKSKQNDQRAEDFRAEFQQAPRGDQSLRYRLWKEQNCTCPYSGRMIPVNSVLSEDTQIDHILPISQSFDNSLSNKVLCFTEENAQKSNRTPFEYLDAADFQRLEAISGNWPEAKRNKLLHKSFGKVAEEWKSRALNDTRYLTSALADHLRHHLPDSKIQTVNGRITGYLRKQWGLEKDRDKHTHHAVDAIVVACTTPAIVQQVTLYHQDIRRYKKLGEKRPTPWPETFRQDVLDVEDEIFITRQPKKVSGGIQTKDTLRKHHSKPDRQRVVLTKVKLADLERLVEKDASNRNLYEHLKQCLEESGDQPTKAFKAPFYMPSGPEAKQRPILSKVTLLREKPEPPKQLTELSGGRRYDSMAQGRLDIYRYKPGGKRKDEYRVVLQRMIDLMRGEENVHVFQKGVPYDQGPEIEQNYTFLFSLYYDDLVEFQRSADSEVIRGYYRTFNIANGQLKISTYLEGRQDFDFFGANRLAHFAKVQVNLLGKVIK
jgi:CRISPR-associated endonuclease Csn1